MKSNNINIVYAPIGGAMKFKKYSRTDGTSEYYFLLKHLLRNPSIGKIYLIQKSDYASLSDQEKHEYDPRGILVDFYETHTRKQTNDDYTLIHKYLEDKEIDFSIINMSYGFFTCVTIPNIYHITGRVCKVQGQVYSYSSSVNYYLSNAKLPWFMIQQDPRYHSKTYGVRDCLHIPLEIWGQKNDKVQWKHMTRYDVPDLIWEDLNVIYNKFEKVNAYNSSIVKHDAEKNVNFALVAMQSAKIKSDKRFKLIQKYILNNDELSDIDIYGKWEEDVTNEYKQFKGLKTSNEIDDIMKRTKYTLVIPIKENFVSSKWIEMISLGVVPFMSPEYDMQCNTVPADHFIRIKDTDDLSSKIKLLNDNDDMRVRLIKELQDTYLNLNDNFIIHEINNALERHNIDIKLSPEQLKDFKPYVSKTIRLF